MSNINRCRTHLLVLFSKVLHFNMHFHISACTKSSPSGGLFAHIRIIPARYPSRPPDICAESQHPSGQMSRRD